MYLRIGLVRGCFWTSASATTSLCEQWNASSARPAGFRVRARSKKPRCWVDRLSIKTPSARLPVSSLSGGNQQRVVLAKWMAANPRVLILNRPTVGIDVGSKPGIHQIIMELAAKKVGVIVVSDDVPELMLICDRVIVMRAGQSWRRGMLARVRSRRSRKS